MCAPPRAGELSPLGVLPATALAADDTGYAYLIGTSSAQTRADVASDLQAVQARLERIRTGNAAVHPTVASRHDR